jgi:hypothetical protein
VEGPDFLRLALVGALACAACTSDEQTICGRLAECQLLPKGYSEAKCEVDVGVHVSDPRLERCAECVTNESCDTLQDACRVDCEPIY